MRLAERDLAPPARFLVTGLGFMAAGEERGWRRYTVSGSGRVVDVQVLPGVQRGEWGVGGRPTEVIDSAGVV